MVYSKKKIGSMVKYGECNRCDNGRESPVRLNLYQFQKGEPAMWLCQWCHHSGQAARVHGLNADDYDEIMRSKEACDCCGAKLLTAAESGIGRGIGRMADVPIYGKLRGVLCQNCFMIIRYLGNDQSKALKVFTYLNLKGFQSK